MKIKGILLITLLLLSYGLSSYYLFGGWWHSSVGTLLIILFSYLIWGKDFLKSTGLQFNYKTALKTITLAIVVTTSAFVLMHYIAGEHDIIITITHWRNYYHDVFYIINEEIVIGFILLFAFVRKGTIKPIIASIGLAIFFALIHFVFYKYIFNDRGILTTSTLVTLFLVGFIRNNLILMTGHIGYSWALHFGWMAIMFGSQHIDLETNSRITELVRFNTYIGSSKMLIISAVLASLSLVYWRKSTHLKLKLW